MDSYEREALRIKLTLLETELKRNGHLDVQPNRTVRNERAIPHTKCPYSKHERQTFETAWQWRVLRNSLRDARHCKCENCGGSTRLQAHHRYYFAGRKPWEYPLDDFLLLCNVCHTIVHKGVDEAIETVIRNYREDEERARLEIDPDMLEWEIDKALGFYDDPVDQYDEDNAGDWEAEYGTDHGDMAEEAALEREMGWDDEEF
jgi:hypothetical protein